MESNTSRSTTIRKMSRQLSAPAPYTKTKHSKRRTSSSSKEIKFSEQLPSFEDTTNAWGFLYKVGGQVFTLSRNMEKPIPGITPGYVISTNHKCDMKTDYFSDKNYNSRIACFPNDFKRHALIHSSPRVVKNKLVFAVFIQDQSSCNTDGVWVNRVNISKTVVELKSGDTIHFKDPIKYPKATVNPSYDFVKPRREGKQFSSFNDSYHRVKDIGNGAFGVVFLAICKTSGKRVAVKQVQLSDKLDVAETKKRVALLREISVFMAFPAHPCIIRVNKVFEENMRMHIVMEYGPNGDLFTHVSEAESNDFSPMPELYNLYMTEPEIKIIFEQIAHAVLFLHTKGIVHRDIKMENVIMCDREKLTVKLCDFGLCTFLKKDEALYTSCGTVMYAAPELLVSSPDDHKGYGMEVDIWSLGVLLYCALTNTTPFKNKVVGEDEKHTQLKALIVKGVVKFDHPSWNRISENAKDLVRRMMLLDISQRPTIQEVLSHPWLQNIEDAVTKEMGVTRNPELLQYISNNSL